MKTKKYFLILAFFIISMNLFAQSSATISSKSGLYACMKGDTVIVLAVKITIPANHCKIKSYVIKWGDGKTESFNKVIDISTQVQELEHTHQYDMSKFVKSCNASIDYNVELQTTNEACKDANDRNITPITFKNLPLITFNKPNTICVGETAKFSYKGCPNNIDAYNFDYGDGSTGTTASHTYIKEGEYQIKIVGKNDCGEGNAATQTLKVVGLPEAVSKISGETATRNDTIFMCLSKNNILNLDSKSSKNYSKITWNIVGNNVEYLNKTNKNSEIVSIKLSKAGIYTISLTVENECSKKATSLNKVIKVLDEGGLTLQPFADQCTKVTYKIPNPNKDAQYYINGKPIGLTEVVSLDISNQPYIIEGRLSNLCGTQVVRDTFYVQNLEKVTFDKQDMVLCIGTNAIDIKASIKGGKWEGKNIKTKDNIATFSPTTAGVYPLKYTVGTGNCLNSASINISVIEIKPIISNSDICMQDSQSLILKATPVGGTFSSSDCISCIDKATLNLATYTKTSINISYQVLENGCVGTTTKKLNISNVKANFQIVGDTCQLNATTKNQTVGASKYIWFLNGKEISTKENTPLTFSNGKNTVKLIAQNGSCSDTLTQEIFRNSSPNNNIISNTELKFCDIKTDKPSYGILTATPKGGVWSSQSYDKFIKGDTLFLEAIKVGSSDFTYTIKENGRCSYSQQVKVTLEGKINAIFSVNPCKQPVEIINTTTGASTFSWLVNNQEIATTRNLSLNLPPNLYTYTLKSIVSPTCYFSQTINFTVSDLEIKSNDITAKKEDKTATLTATPLGGSWTSVSGCLTCLDNNIVSLDKVQGSKAVFRYTYITPNSCKISKDITLTIDSPPISNILKANFSINQRYCEQENIKPENTSIGEIVNYTWFVNNKIISKEKTPEFSQLSVGNNIIKLIVEDKNSRDSLSLQVEIIQKPQPFTVNFDKTTGCSPLEVIASYPPFPANSTFQVDWGDGTIEPNISKKHLYSTTATKIFNYKATVKNECGIQEFKKNIQIENQIKANLQIDTIASKCSPTLVKFNNLSSESGTIWLSAGKTFSIKAQETIVENFTNTQTIPIKINAKFIVKNLCSADSSNLSFYISPACNTNDQPNIGINNVIVKDSICESDYLSINNSILADKYYWIIDNQKYEQLNPTLRLPVGIYYPKFIFIKGTQKDSLVFKVSVFDCKCYLPSKFTPNNDGWNDWLYISANPIIVKKVNQFLIINRWGDVVFSNNDIPVNTPLNGWDGTSAGITQAEDTYYYQCLYELLNGKKIIQKGSFSLMR